MVVERKAFPLRIAKDVFDAMQRWADDDIRSVNAQIEFLLRDALAERGIVPKRALPDKPEDMGEDL